MTDVRKEDRLGAIQLGERFGAPHKQRAWVDELLYGKAKVGEFAIAAGNTLSYDPIWRETQFWNTSIKRFLILGSPETVADTILRIAGQLDLMGLAMIFKLGTMPYDTVERSMRLLGEEVVPRATEQN